MQLTSQLELREIRVDGGAGRSDLLLQLQANLLQCRVTRAAQLESTALGVAYFAGLALGFWQDEADIAKHWKSDGRFVPQCAQSDLSELQIAWQKGIHQRKTLEFGVILRREQVIASMRTHAKRFDLIIIGEAARLASERP